jgi:zinc transport system permease protein
MMFELAFMQRAMAAAVLIGLVCGALGFFVILRRLAFIGVGISHSALGGVAIGVLLGVSPLLCAAVVAVLAALGIGRMARRGMLEEDALIGVFLSTAMALGIVLIGLHKGYRQDLLGYLFGNVLTVSTGELWGLAALTLAVLGTLLLTFPALLLISFDEEIARAYGYPVDRLNALLLVLLSVTIVFGVQLVGVLLIEALLVVPAATAALWTANFRQQMPLSAALGVTAGILGLSASYHLDVAAGGSIVLLLSTAFFLSALVRRRT